jgi:hypothetical protein
MKLAAKYDVEAPAAFVFAQLTDFDGWERAAMRRGADVMRTDALRSIGPGMTWDAQFHYRNKDRKTTIRLDAIQPINHLAMSGKSAPVDGVLAIDILDLGAKRTRVEVKLEVKPNTIAARIYVQSLRLARARVERGFAQRVAQLAVEIEDRFRGAQRR